MRVLAGVPTGPVEHHEGVLVLGQRRREAPKKLVHRDGGDDRQHQTEIAARRRFHGGEDIGEGVALIDRPGRPLAAQPPAAAGAALLSEPGFVLKVERDALARVRAGQLGEERGQLLF